MLKIIGDTTCNLPPELLQRHKIPVGPIAIQFGEGKAYDEFITMDQDIFYRKIPGKLAHPDHLTAFPALVRGGTAAA